MIDLSNTTLWSCYWSGKSDEYVRTVRVLNYCQKIAKFGRVILFAHHPPPIKVNAECIQIPRLDMAQWNLFVNKTVPAMVDCDYLMSVHHDGFPIRPDLWSEDFLKYDYIGAPWVDGVVGNGGFNIESRKLLKAKLGMSFIGANQLEASDYWTCRTHRAELEQAGIQFAPKELALKFSTETIGNEQESFGFHGIKWRGSKYEQGWKKIRQMESICDSIPAVVYQVPMNNLPEFMPCIRRWVESYLKFKPSIPHNVHICFCNGKPTEEVISILSGIEYQSHYYDGGGWDIGAYQFMAGQLAGKADLAVFMNTRSHLWRNGWLERFCEAFNKHGNGLYGATASYERCPRNRKDRGINPHIRTACFACNPATLALFPHVVDSRDEGFRFESGDWNFSKWFESLGLPVLMLTWTDEYRKSEWRKPLHIFRRGNQSNCIVWDRHTALFADASHQTKLGLSAFADRG